jgi:hypothetical protein
MDVIARTVAINAISTLTVERKAAAALESPATSRGVSRRRL